MSKGTQFIYSRFLTLIILQVKFSKCLFISLFICCSVLEPSTSEKQKMSAKASAISFDLTPMSVKPVVEEVSKDAEQSDAKKRARLSELLKKYEGTFDMTGVRTAIDSLEKAKNGAATDLIELDGKVMVKRDVNRRLDF